MKNTNDDNNELANAQRELTRRRAAAGSRPDLRPLADLAARFEPGRASAAAEPAGAALGPDRQQSEPITPIDAFTFDHLTAGDQRIKMIVAIKKTEKWIDAGHDAGRSLVFAGAFGTGKTTLAKNAARSIRTTARPAYLTESGQLAPVDPAYVDLLRAAQKRTPAGSDPWRQLAAMIAGDDPAPAVSLPSYRLLSESELMGVVMSADNPDRDRVPLSAAFNRERVIIVDDVGDGRVPYTVDGRQTERRRQLYRLFFEFCINHGRAVIMTTNLQIGSDGGALAACVGPAAWDRLYQMARGFFVNTHGLPSYRAYSVNA